LEGNALINTYRFSFAFKQIVDGTVLAESEERAIELLKEEFGDFIDFELLELIPEDEVAPITLEAVPTVN
jgi:hypothetical protein